MVDPNGSIGWFDWLVVWFVQLVGSVVGTRGWFNWLVYMVAPNDSIGWFDWLVQLVYLCDLPILLGCFAGIVHVYTNMVSCVCVCLCWCVSVCGLVCMNSGLI